MYTLYPELGPQEREEQLKRMAVKVERRNYTRTLSDAEVAAERIRFVDDALEQQKLERELENTSKDYKERIKNIEKRSEERLEVINSKKKSLSGDLYGIANHAEGRMLLYDKYGELIDSRDLLPEERQGKLFDTAVSKPSDLPLETQQVVDQIVKEQNAEVQDAEYEEVHEVDSQTFEKAGGLSGNAVDALSDEYLASIPHAEDGWEGMNDAQLMKKYGTTKISVIRTMEWNEEKGKYVVQKTPDKALRRRNAGNN